MPKSVKGVMKEYAEGALHSGSPRGLVVRDPKQAVAIAMSERRQESHSKRGRAHHGRSDKSTTSRAHGYCAPKES